MLIRICYALAYCVRFLKELALANYQVAKLVLAPASQLNPGFVAVPLTATTDLEITLFANSITLTPGTISVYIPEDRQVIVMHAIDLGNDIDALRQATKAALEAPILRFTRKERSA
jgi:multicomponent Na+:H+ antiporter subunit E